jgi:hypothetical protein
MYKATPPDERASETVDVNGRPSSSSAQVRLLSLVVLVLSVLSGCTPYWCVLIFLARLLKHDFKITKINKLRKISRHMILLLSLTLFCAHTYDGCCQTTNLRRRCRTSISKTRNTLPLLAYLHLYLLLCPLPLYPLFHPLLLLPLAAFYQILNLSRKPPASRRWTPPSRYVSMSCLEMVFAWTRDVRMSI